MQSLLLSSHFCFGEGLFDDIFIVLHKRTSPTSTQSDSQSEGIVPTPTMKNSGFTGIACALLCLILLVKKTVGFQNFMAVGHRRQHASCGVPKNTHSIVLTTICIPPSSVATRIFASHNSRIPSTRRTWSPVSSIKTKASKASPIKRTTTAPIP